MLDAIWSQIQTWLALGSNTQDVDAVAMTFRTVIIYLFTLFIVRLASKRILSRATAFDYIVAIMLGSIMSRAINGSAPFVPTMVAGAALLFLHWLFAVLAFHTDWFGFLVKGNAVLLIKDGEIQSEGMKKSEISQRDLHEAMRLEGKEPDISKIHRAYLERSGKISIIPRHSPPQILEVKVADGVQTVRIEIS